MQGLQTRVDEVQMSWEVMLARVNALESGCGDHRNGGVRQAQHQENQKYRIQDLHQQRVHADSASLHNPSLLLSSLPEERHQSPSPLPEPTLQELRDHHRLRRLALKEQRRSSRASLSASTECSQSVSKDQKVS